MFAHSVCLGQANDVQGENLEVVQGNRRFDDLQVWARAVSDALRPKTDLPHRYTSQQRYAASECARELRNGLESL